LGKEQIPEGPSFDMAATSKRLWQVFGHQVFVDGFFSTDPHPGNIMVDEKTGALGLIDYGQAIEISMEVRVRFARVILAVANGNDAEIAQAMAQCGVRSRYMNTEHIAMVGKFALSNLMPTKELLERAELLDKEDPDIDFMKYDAKFGLLFMSVGMVRGSSMCLLSLDNCPVTMWKDTARSFVERHGSDYPERNPIAMDLHLRKR